MFRKVTVFDMKDNNLSFVPYLIFRHNLLKVQRTCPKVSAHTFLFSQKSFGFREEIKSEGARSGESRLDAEAVKSAVLSIFAKRHG